MCNNMSSVTFLGTPLSKYEIDDIETDLTNKRAKDFEKTKGLQYRQNRERIKRNQITTHYTVDTNEGFVPANFKSSKTIRASYAQQNVRTFTDVEDADIITKNTLKAIKIDRVGLKRNIANILNAIGFMGKKRFIGPINIHVVQTKISTSLEGVGFNFDVETAVEKVQFVRSKDSSCEPGAYKEKCSNAFANKSEESTESGDSEKATAVKPIGNSSGTVKMAGIAKHADDRQFDLSEVQFYYKHLYGSIVKLIEVKEDFMEKVAEGLDFTNKSMVNEKKAVETGRKVELYTFDDELLRRFKVKTSISKDENYLNSANNNVGEESGIAAKLPMELFQRIFGK